MKTICKFSRDLHRFEKTLANLDSLPEDNGFNAAYFRKYYLQSIPGCLTELATLSELKGVNIGAVKTMYADIYLLMKRMGINVNSNPQIKKINNKLFPGKVINEKKMKEIRIAPFKKNRFST